MMTRLFVVRKHFAEALIAFCLLYCRHEFPLFPSAVAQWAYVGERSTAIIAIQFFCHLGSSPLLARDQSPNMIIVYNMYCKVDPLWSSTADMMLLLFT